MIEEIEGCSKYDAICIAGDIAGGKELYQINDGDGFEQEIERKERLSSNDLNLLDCFNLKKELISQNKSLHMIRQKNFNKQKDPALQSI